MADLVVIVGLHFVEKSMKAQAATRELEEKEAYNKKHEDNKVTKASMKTAQREEQKRSQEQLKSAPKGSAAHINRAVHQPDKTK